jgi:hypothetical protein
MVKALTSGQRIEQNDIVELENALIFLNSMPEQNGKKLAKVAPELTVSLDVSYEQNELEKDLFFLKNSEADFLEYFSTIHSDFGKQVEDCVKFLGNKHFNLFATDRDGTINNYCDRYNSSVQSVYNSVFITEFAEHRSKNSIILTSAPLDNTGLLDLSVNPEKVFIYAGSKGREFYDRIGVRRTLAIPPQQQKLFSELNARLVDLVKAHNNKGKTAIEVGNKKHYLNKRSLTIKYD